MADNPLSKSGTRGLVWAKTDGKCWYCGIQTNPWGDFCVDHIDPLSISGTNNLENLVPCCSVCNRRKSGRTLKAFREYIMAIEGSIFTPEQLTYLDSKGIELPEPDKHIFYFEKIGLEI